MDSPYANTLFILLPRIRLNLFPSTTIPPQIYIFNSPQTFGKNDSFNRLLQRCTTSQKPHRLPSHRATAEHLPNAISPPPLHDIAVQGPKETVKPCQASNRLRRGVPSGHLGETKRGSTNMTGSGDTAPTSETEVFFCRLFGFSFQMMACRLISVNGFLRLMVKG